MQAHASKNRESGSGSLDLQARRDEILPGIHRLTICPPGSPISFNHFVLTGSQPGIVHLGMRSIFPPLKTLVGQVVDPTLLTNLVASHYESDECGALNLWQELAPDSTFVASKLCCNSVRDSALRPPKGVKDGDLIVLGNERLRVLETPHFPHGWDACLFYAETSRVLFGSDLGTQGGFSPPWVDGDPTDKILNLQKKLGYLNGGPAAKNAIDRLLTLDIEVMATMHGPALNREQSQRLLRALKLITEENKSP